MAIVSTSDTIRLEEERAFAQMQAIGQQCPFERADNHIDL